MSPLSVVMATNRFDSYLGQAVSSVLANEGVELELVLVLDGIRVPQSPPDWIRDERIKLVARKTSAGLGAALNEGIMTARHELIARLDADDNAAPDRFREQLEILARCKPPVLVGSRAVLIDEAGSLLRGARGSCGADVRRTLLFHNVVPHSSYMFRKTDAIAAGMYREDLRQMEDYDFLLRMALLGPVTVVCEPLIEYRIHSTQMSKRAGWRGDYVTAVTSGRKRLGESLGVPNALVTLANTLWRIYQVARALRIAKPLHMAGVNGRNIAEFES